MSENQKTGPVTTVTAIDRDIDENARLTYTLKESDRTYFSIETIPPNAGVLTVYRVGAHFFTLLSSLYAVLLYVINNS